MKKEFPKGQTKPKRKKLSHVDKELYWIFGVAIGLILVFLAANSVFQSLNGFEYRGLTFTKERFGEIPLFRYSYFTEPSPVTGAVTREPRLINVYLRNDPRTNNVPIEGEIEFPDKGRQLYISINSTGLTQCTYTSVALSSLTSFLASNGFAVKGSVPDEKEAEEKNTRYVTCETNPDNAVILIQEGEETRITRKNGCYIMDVNNCEILPATEKFMVRAIIDARARKGLN